MFAETAQGPTSAFQESLKAFQTQQQQNTSTEIDFTGNMYFSTKDVNEHLQALPIFPKFSDPQKLSFQGNSSNEPMFRPKPKPLAASSTGVETA